MSDTPKLSARKIGRTISGFFALLFTLCTIFAAVVAAIEARQERVEATWPEITAHIDDCALDQSDTGERDRYSIHCRFTYSVGADQDALTVYSRPVPGRDALQFPKNQIGPYEDWVASHPKGTPVVIRYNPASPGKAALLSTDMPGAGSHTRSNLMLLGVAIAGLLITLTINQVLR